MVDSVAGLIYATQASTGTVEVTDAVTNTVVDSIAIGCTSARLVQNAARTRLYVTCATGFPGDPLKVVDLATSAVIATIPLGRGPQGVDITPDDAFVYAANILDDDVSVIATATNTVIDTIAVGGLPVANGRFISQAFVCGNGTHEPGEECDDGGTTPGDGCDALCEKEGCATRVGVTATKLIVVDKTAIAGSAKFVFVAKDQSGAITKGAGTTVGDIAVELDVAYTDGSATGAFVIPAGASDGTAGWLVNKETVAKYVNRSAPGGPTETKVAVIKPGKLVKLVGKGLGDTPLDILGAGEPTAQAAGEVVTAYRVTNGGEETCHCSAFAECAYKSIAAGTGAKLVCKGGVPDGDCTAFTGP
jgi:YVTN family beta-propeller protein/cysteine-rich repeat protein